VIATSRSIGASAVTASGSAAPTAKVEASAACEFFANALIVIVALHVGYLVAFKWPVARFMLFIRQPRKPSAAKPAP